MLSKIAQDAKKIIQFDLIGLGQLIEELLGWIRSTFVAGKRNPERISGICQPAFGAQSPSPNIKLKVNRAQDYFCKFFARKCALFNSVLAQIETCQQVTPQVSECKRDIPFDLTYTPAFSDTVCMLNSENYGIAVMAMCMCMECGPVRLVSERQMR
jgi:hypothetical protein